jgi:hypothetical protein
MATSFGDYINNLLKNISPTGGMMSPEQQAAYEDAQAYAADPFRRQNAIRKAAEEAAAAAAAQQVAVDPAQKYSGGSSYRAERTPMQEAYLTWEETTPEGQAVREERMSNVNKALFGALGGVMPAAGLMMAGSQLLQGKELSELTPDYQKILGMGDGYEYGYPVQFLEQYAKANPLDPQLIGYGRVGNFWDSLFGNQTAAPVVDAVAPVYASGLSPAYIASIAEQYGTNPGSVQTSMLAAQDSWFNEPSSSSGGSGGYNSRDTSTASDTSGGGGRVSANDRD